MQIGDSTNDVKIVVSTIAEAEHLLDYLLECQKIGKKVNVRPCPAVGVNVQENCTLICVEQVLYGIPLPPSQLPRLAHLGTKLGPDSVSVIIDDVSQLSAAQVFKETTGFPLQIFVKVDTGYHRAGLPAGTATFQILVKAIFDLESRGSVLLMGFYCHAGHSYGGDSSLGAMDMLVDEIQGLEIAAIEAHSFRSSRSSPVPYTLSVGATPTATSVENLLADQHNQTAIKLKVLIERAKSSYIIELHAGVYPFLDMQQLATNASPTAAENAGGPLTAISFADVALSILIEVVSVYEGRGKPEALIAAGTLALGREPCKSYDGWGIVSDWGMKPDDPTGECGWKVGRISQEHSILSLHPNGNKGARSLHVGQQLRVWPNHACVASAGFSWYLVVDSSLGKDRHNEIVDVWINCRGW